MKRIIVIVLIVICFSTNAKNIFVDQGSKASVQNKNGLTLSAAFTNLQPAIDAAADGDVILVQSNPPLSGNSTGYVYVPTDFPPGSDTSDPRNKAFHTDGKKLAILGGLSQLSYFGSAPTILSGDFNQDDNLVGGSNSENAYHVFVLDNVDDTFRFDRIEFRDGNANGTSSFNLSGQLNQTIAQNQGAGLYIVNASPLLIATLFSGNHADANGAGLYNHNSSPQLFNSVFNDNKADGNGAGIYNDVTSVPQIINNTFVRNDAIGDGGGLFNQSATPVLVSNTVFYYNTAINGSDIGGVSLDGVSTHNASDSNGGGIATGVGFVDLSATPASAIFEDILNPEINYFGEFANGLLITKSSGFVPVVDSPLLNAGLNSENSLLTAPFLYPLVFVDDENTQILDPLTHPRVKVCKIDIGAYEVSDIMIHVDSAAPDNTGGGGSWDTALRDLQVGFDCAIEDDTVILAQGVYKPTESPDEISTYPRDRAFHINKTITVKGGFDPLTGIQDFNTPSILSGDFLGDDVVTGSGETLVITGNDENAKHVMIVVAPNGFFINNSNFENLNIQGGNAINEGSIDYSGLTIFHNLAGGMFFFKARAHLDNMIIMHNSALTAAGGIWEEHSDNVLTNIQFISNQVTGVGGAFGNLGAGFFTASGGALLTNVVFFGNLAEAGGGMAVNASGVTLFNVLFYKNHARGNGGGLGLYNNLVSAFLINVSFIQNSSASATPPIFPNELSGGGGLYQSEFNSFIPPSLRNTVFFGNTATEGGADLILNDTNVLTGIGLLDTNNFTYNNASDGTGAGIDTTANFTDLSGALASDVFTDINDPDGADNKFATADDGLVPISISPLVDSGDNAANTTALDLANIPRVYQTTIDKGAYEYFVEGVFIDGFE